MGRALSADEARRLAPLVLAYVGDAVYETYVRARFAAGGERPARLHAHCVRWVSARGQARVLECLESGAPPLALTAEEREIARRGRNAKGGLPQRVDPVLYRRSTALEALVGYLYVTGREARVQELLDQAFTVLAAEVDGGGAPQGDPGGE